MLRSVEGHVLQEVGKTELIGCLQSRTDFLSNIEIDSLFRLFVMKNVIIQAVGEFTMPYFGIKRQRSLGGCAQH